MVSPSPDKDRQKINPGTSGIQPNRPMADTKEVSLMLERRRDVLQLILSQTVDLSHEPQIEEADIKKLENELLKIAITYLEVVDVVISMQNEEEKKYTNMIPETQEELSHCTGFVRALEAGWKEMNDCAQKFKAIYKKLKMELKKDENKNVESTIFLNDIVQEVSSDLKIC